MGLELRRGVLKIAAKPAIIRILGPHAKTAYHRAMFSYRHAFHAGNHADVLKHAVWIALLQRLTEKDKGIQVIDTHAGVGVYRLVAEKRGEAHEADEGVLKLLAQGSDVTKLPLLVREYVKVITDFNDGKAVTHYPGSPAISAQLLREQDQLEVFEVHPTDHRTLRSWADSAPTQASVTMNRVNGFECVKKLLPPPTRRGVLMCDPSYELKTDYADVANLLQEALLRFATGVYMIWIPQVARAEAHELPRKLRSIATKAGKPWLQALLQVRGTNLGAPGGGLAGSTVFVVNPSFGLRESLQEALPFLVRTLGQDNKARFDLQSGG